MILEFFPPVALALQKEVVNHPRLIAALTRLPTNSELEERLAIILAYVGIQVDGEFFEEDLEQLFNLAYQRLCSMRATLIS